MMHKLAIDEASVKIYFCIIYNDALIKGGWER